MTFVRFLAFLFLTAGILRGEDPELRRQLERSYGAWKQSLIAADLSGWQQSTAAHRQMLTRNLIVSQKQPFPHALFAIPMRPPEIATLRFLGSTVKGNTANLAYFGKVDLGLVDQSEIPESLLILKFVRESTGWKFDTTRLINLGSAPEIQAALKNGGRANFLDDPEFAPTGEVPAVPKACPVPDRIGVLQIASFGYATRVSVNGFDVATVQDNAEEHLVIGGLKNGDNPTTVEAKQLPVPEGAERSLEINAIILTGEQKRPTIQVFSWKAEKHPVPEFQKMMIFVNKITMRE
ncbi:hypothetical protein DES53_101412 [Roseimicrobium gellanilyticum]|uniref:Uncharacterized protein n=1 Tax=Roseimicrobium gellanilyticum TaxID=748857 RepID=A0A366HVU5_9BACT|nr:hypothetical protein [Roseimicrobium gellanilyticum]RBP47615.1 hypothetical protein DES53_101412 [Roseimicrobium gellanilyticum]